MGQEPGRWLCRETPEGERQRSSIGRSTPVMQTSRQVAWDYWPSRSLGRADSRCGVFLRGRRTRLTLGEGARNGHSWDRRNATHPRAEAETPRCVAGRASDRRRIRLAQPGGLAPTPGAQVRCASAGVETVACSESGRWLCRDTPESEWRQCEHWAIRSRDRAPGCAKTIVLRSGRRRSHGGTRAAGGGVPGTYPLPRGSMPRCRP